MRLKDSSMSNTVRHCEGVFAVRLRYNHFFQKTDAFNKESKMSFFLDKTTLSRMSNKSPSRIDRRHLRSSMFARFSLVCIVSLFFVISHARAENVDLDMVFVPASEKGDESDYLGLIKIIESLTGYSLSPIKVTDYNAAVEAMRAGRADIAWFGGKTYIVAAELAGAEAFAAGIRKGDVDATYLTYFVVPEKSRINVLSDVRGTTIALNNIGSTSGDLIPQVELATVGLSLTNGDHFEHVFYAGSHDACLLSVINGHADVCAMSSRNFDARLADKTFERSQVRIIHSSAPVPPPPLAYSKRLPLEVRNRIKSAVLDAHNHGRIGGYGGEMERYVEVQDSDYDILRAVEEKLRDAQSQQ